MNRTEFAILGLLGQGPKSGYDIKRLVEERLSHFWNESVGHIYPILRRLHERGWVEKRVTPSESRPPRHEYALTVAGRRELERWFTEPVAPVPPRNELLLRVFLGAMAPAGAVAAQVAAYRERRLSEMKRLESVAAELERAARADPEFVWWRMTLSAGIHAARSAVAWCDEVLPDLTKKPTENGEVA